MQLYCWKCNLLFLTDNGIADALQTDITLENKATS